MLELLSNELLVVKINLEACTAASLVAIVFLWNIKLSQQFSQNVSTKQSATLTHCIHDIHWKSQNILKVVVNLGCLS